MTRYDDVIGAGRKARKEEVTASLEKMADEAKKKSIYVEAIKKALPEFHQALIKNDIWNEYKQIEKILLFDKINTIECALLKKWDPREYWFETDNVGITKEGRYIRLLNAKYVQYKNEYMTTVDNYQILSLQEMAEHIYENMCLDKVTNYSSYTDPYTELNQALNNNEPDEAVFQYFVVCLPKQSNNRP
jgi:hypothetical protein